MVENGSSLEDRVIAAWARRRLLPRPAARLLLSVTESLTLAGLAALTRLRQRGDSEARLFAENKSLRLRLSELAAENEILRSKISRVAPRERPRYTPDVRFRIIEHMRRFALSVDETARRFLVTPQTLYNWLHELDRNPEGASIGSLLKPEPPIRRYGDVARRAARQMKAFGFEGCGQIAMTLARFGWKPSRSSVSRFCKERPLPGRVPPMPGTSRLTNVRGRYPNHLVLADITRIPLVFPFLRLHLAVVLDAFSRMPLQAMLSYVEPSAEAMLALVEKAFRIHGKPRHFVSDQGSQFTSEVFRRALEQLGVRQRFGALRRARLDRADRTLLQNPEARPPGGEELAAFGSPLEPRRIRTAIDRGTDSLLVLPPALGSWWSRACRGVLRNRGSAARGQLRAERQAR